MRRTDGKRVANFRAELALKVNAHNLGVSLRECPEACKLAVAGGTGCVQQDTDDGVEPLVGVLEELFQTGGTAGPGGTTPCSRLRSSPTHRQADGAGGRAAMWLRCRPGWWGTELTLETV